MKLFIMWFTASEVIKGTMTIGDLTSFSLYAMNLYGTLNGLFNQLISLQYLFVSMGRLHEMFSIAPEFETGDRVTTSYTPVNIDGEIIFKDVSFGYEENMPVLKNVSLAVHPGEVVAITGASGAGKTTLISLILKLYDPQAGNILLDGNDLRQLSTQWLRAQIGIVSQETFLFNDTIEHNIKYGKPQATFDEVKEAARKAHIDKDIEGFEEGYQTVVGERGSKLSVGQKQRISLARAFLKDPPILILDEPTSALDKEAEGAITYTLREVTKNRTTFLITHHAPIVGIAHRIFVLSNGVLKEKTVE
jgi:subfamily B ATP-binding cassette protein MsbA